MAALMTWLAAFLIASMPVFLVTAALWACEWHRGQRNTDWRRNLQAWVLTRSVSVVILPLIPLWAGRNWSLIDGSALPFWLGFPIFVISRDFIEYLFHRAQHHIPALWAMHSLHHSDPDMMVLTNQRQFWGDQFVKQLTIWPIAMSFMSLTPEIIAAFGIFGLWNLFLHSGLPISFGRWSWLLTSPEYHRHHHSKITEHIGSNFSSFFPIFDVIFGNYRPRSGHPETGLERKPESFGELLIWPLIWHRHAAANRLTVSRPSQGPVPDPGSNASGAQ